jgi:hypothetical protein
LYPEERPDFVLPERYKLSAKQQGRQSHDNNDSNNNSSQNEENDGNNEDDDNSRSIPHHHARRTDSGEPNAFHHSNLAPGGDHERYGRPPSEDSQATLVIEESMITRQGAQGIPPDKIRELLQDPNIVTWYGVDDMENPTNWFVYRVGRHVSYH